MNVADLKLGEKDSMGEKVRGLFGFKPPHYAVYSIRRRISIQFADDGDEADRQRQALAQLAPLRGEIDGLIDGWRDGSAHSFFGLENSSALESKASRYERRVGDALVVALENQLQLAKDTLTSIRADILNERIAWARFEYLIAAFATALMALFGTWLAAQCYPLGGGKTASPMWQVGLMLLLFCAAAGLAVFLAGTQRKGQEEGNSGNENSNQNTAADGQGGDGRKKGNKNRGFAAAWGVFSSLGVAFLLFTLLAIPVVSVLIFPSFKYADEAKDLMPAINVWRAAAAGAVGAFFSIAIGMRTRTVLPDLLRTSNVMDALLRVTIGFIAGAVLLALLHEKVVAIQFGPKQMQDATTLSVVLLGFIAGFSERMVPDLLAKATASVGGSAGPSSPVNPAPPNPGAPPPSGANTPVQGQPPAPPASDPHPEQAAEDGCASAIDAKDSDATPDIQLPPAAGGVASPPPGGAAAPAQGGGK